MILFSGFLRLKCPGKEEKGPDKGESEWYCSVWPFSYEGPDENRREFS